MSTRELFLAASAISLAAAPCQAQETISQQKDVVALAAAQQALDAARQKQLLDALAAIKQPTEGKASLSDPASTAEGLVVADTALRNAALLMAGHVLTWRTAHAGADQPLLVILGSQAPSIAQWQAFDRMSTELKERLELVSKDWKMVTASAGDGTGGGEVGMLMAPLAGPAVVTTLVSLLKTDYAIAGTKLAPSTDATRAILVWALRTKGVSVQLPEFQIAGPPTGVKSRLDEIAPLKKAAAGFYHDDYLKRLAAAGGKPEKLDAAIAAAGANLVTALADYDAMVKALYTPAGAVLPAVEVERQRLIAAAAAKQPVLYITNFSSALSAVTKKGLFTGTSSTPASLRVASSIDFVLTVGLVTDPDRVIYVSPILSFDRATDYSISVDGVTATVTK